MEGDLDFQILSKKEKTKTQISLRELDTTTLINLS